MPKRFMKRKDRAVSPVIATIILVAIAIVMSIAVAYWALGLGGTFTRYEKIEIMSMYATGSAGNWEIKATLRNTGTAPTTINLVLINGKPSGEYTGVISVDPDPDTDPQTINPGEKKEFTIEITDTNGKYFVSGMSVEITFHTAAGSDYPKVVVLP